MKIEEDKNTEKLILESAEALFLEQGFAKTTTSQIAQRAGCNQALVHYYYRTKEKLFDRIFEDKVRVFLSSFLDVKNEGLTFEEKLKSLIEVHYDYLLNNSKIPIFIYREMSDNANRTKLMIKKIRNYPKEFLLTLEKELEIEKAKGNIRDISAVDLLLTIISLNIMLFLMKPLIQTALDASDEQIESILAKRKSEIVQTVLTRIKV